MKIVVSMAGRLVESIAVANSQSLTGSTDGDEVEQRAERRADQRARAGIELRAALRFDDHVAGIGEAVEAGARDRLQHRCDGVVGIAAAAVGGAVGAAPPRAGDGELDGVAAGRRPGDQRRALMRRARGGWCDRRSAREQREQQRRATQPSSQQRPIRRARIAHPLFPQPAARDEAPCPENARATDRNPAHVLHRAVAAFTMPSCSSAHCGIPLSP